MKMSHMQFFWTPEILTHTHENFLTSIINFRVAINRNNILLLPSALLLHLLRSLKDMGF